MAALLHGSLESARIDLFYTLSTFSASNQTATNDSTAAAAAAAAEFQFAFSSPSKKMAMTVSGLAFSNHTRYTTASNALSFHVPGELAEAISGLSKDDLIVDVILPGNNASQKLSLPLWTDLSGLLFVCCLLFVVCRLLSVACSVICSCCLLLFAEKWLVICKCACQFMMLKCTWLFFSPLTPFLLFPNSSRSCCWRHLGHLQSRDSV